MRPVVTRTFATLATSHSYGQAGAGVLVGRLVANTSFVRALARHADFDRFRFYVGEASDAETVRGLFETELEGRLELANMVDLPQHLARGEVSVLHHGSHLDRFLDLVHLRDRYATSTVPVTGQIHTLSYPRSTNDYLRALLLPPRREDAILCSSETGRRVVEGVFEELRTELASRGVELDALECELPVIPLGVDVEALGGGDGPQLRQELSIPNDALCALVLARFSEYDKMDLFPLLLAFRAAAKRLDRPAVLLLAGARQGTRTPEMLQLWARALGFGDDVRFLVDFPEDRKRDVLAAADVFVSPTDNPQETFGITVVEAMAAGVPQIVTDFDGYRESVTEETGIRVPTHWLPPSSELRDVSPLLYERPLHLFLGQGVSVELEALEDAIVQLGRDPARREAMSRASVARARERYDWRGVIAETDALWKRLAEHPFQPRDVGRHPLALDFERTFAHYPTGTLAPDRLLRVSEHGRWTTEAGLHHPIHPELQNLFGDQLVAAALGGAAAPVRADELTDALAEALPDSPRWKLERMVAWMEKQGLLVATDQSSPA